MLFCRQTRGGNHRKWGAIFVLWQACKTPNWNGIDSWLMVGVFGKLLSQDFFLAVSRDNKEVYLVCIGKLVLVVVVPQDILIIDIIGTEVLCMDDHTQAGLLRFFKDRLTDVGFPIQNHQIFFGQLKGLHEVADQFLATNQITIWETVDFAAICHLHAVGNRPVLIVKPALNQVGLVVLGNEVLRTIAGIGEIILSHQNSSRHVLAAFDIGTVFCAQVAGQKVVLILIKEALDLTIDFFTSRFSGKSC